MKEIIAIVGWVVGIQGALGLIGRWTTGNDWGLLHLWFDPPTALYVVMAVAGAALATWGERSRKSAH